MPPILISIGEILWDLYPGQRLLGGAPFNLAAHAARLGFEAYFISAVGRDELGDEALARAATLGVNTKYVRSHPTLPTGVVHVSLDRDGHPTYELARPSAWEEPELSDCQAAALQALRPAWLVCGTLQQTCPMARAARRSLEGIPIFYDVNLRPGFEDPCTVDELLRAASVVKCNDLELAWLACELKLDGDPADAILRRYPLAVLCVTMGAAGCEIHGHGEVLTMRPPAAIGADTVGAGDAFSAALLYGLTKHWPIEQCARLANALGSLVASRPGAIPDWTREELDSAANFQ